MEKEYLALEFSIDPKEVGTEFPQIQKMSPGYNYHSPNSIYELEKYQEALPAFEPDLDFFVLENKAKPTDLLSLSMNTTTGLLVSDRFKEILMSHSLPQHRFYRTSVQKKDQIFNNYSWLQLTTNALEFVDFSKSTFKILKNFDSSIGSIKIKSAADYETESLRLSKNEEEDTLAIWGDQIIMADNFDASLDLFYISNINGAYLISHRLANSLKKSLVNGYITKPSNVSLGM